MAFYRRRSGRLPLVSQPSYIAYYSGGVYRAKSTLPALPDLANANPRIVLQACLDAKCKTLLKRSFNGAVLDQLLTVPVLELNEAATLEAELPGTQLVHNAGTADAMMKYNHAHYHLGLGSPKLTLKNLAFIYTAHDASNICLDFNYLDVDMDNVLAYNADGSRRGDGIYVRPAANSNSNIWRSVVASKFTRDFFISQDHLTLINPCAANYLGNAFSITWCGWVSIINPHVYCDTNPISADAHWIFSGTLRGFVIVESAIEGNGGKPIFAHFGTANDWPTMVYGHFRENNTDPMFLDAATRHHVVVHASRLADCSVNFAANAGYETGNGAQQTIAHGLGFTPAYTDVLLSERTTGGALPRQTAAPDAVNIYVTATNAKDYNWRVSEQPQT
jgi:hypothetical protein